MGKAVIIVGGVLLIAAVAGLVFPPAAVATVLGVSLFSAKTILAAGVVGSLILIGRAYYFSFEVRTPSDAKIIAGFVPHKIGEHVVKHQRKEGHLTIQIPQKVFDGSSQVRLGT